jgi:hypothetical protein
VSAFAKLWKFDIKRLIRNHHAMVLVAAGLSILRKYIKILFLGKVSVIFVEI